MDRVAVFVDAGYLFAQGSVALCGRKRPRADFEFSPERSITSIETLATSVSGLPLLRVYWYDGSSTGPSMQHLSLAHLPRVKVRLGFVNSMGEQKGVDSLIVIDMITLARNRAMTDAMLLSGDEDLRVGVQQAQEFGVRVHLLGIRPGRGSQSLFLLREADTTHEWGPSELTAFMNLREGQGSRRDTAVLGPAPVSVAEVLDAVVLEVLAEVPDEELRALVPSIRQQRRIPRELDARLLVSARTRVGRALTAEERRVLREAFLRECERRIASGRLPGRPGFGADRGSP